MGGVGISRFKLVFVALALLAPALNAAPTQAAGACPGGEQAVSGGGCTHGGDPKPPDAHAPTPVRRAMAASALCSNPGSDGDRVQALYVYPSNQSNDLDTWLESIKQYATNVDLAFNSSAAETGGTRHVRFLTDANCNLQVDAVSVTTAAVASGDSEIVSAFNSMVNQLAAKGYTRKSDRKYLIWFDKDDATCGIGDRYVDDSAAISNANNTHGGYARADKGCWDYAEKHELMHTFGGVQNSAPHSSSLRGGSGHCFDEHDIMCYKDGANVTLDYDCPDTAREDLFDCNHDDYFNTDPPAGSYLASHWNTANSGWLDTDGTPPPPPPGDTMPPDCQRASATRSKIFVPVRDTGSGLASLTATSSNLSVSYPTFAPGTTASQTVTGKKVNRSKRAKIAVTATDVDGNQQVCAWKF